MKTKIQKHQPRPSSQERWAFSLSSERLFTLGATAKTKYAAFRMADGQVRLFSL